MFNFNGSLHQVSQSKVTIYLLNTILAFLILASAYHWTRLYLDRDYNRLLVASISNNQNAADTSVTASALISYPLFGMAENTGSGLQKDIPLSSLNIKLYGVVASDNGGFALISVNGQPQSAFYVGESVTGDAVLDQVLSDRIILRRGNSRESVFLESVDQLSKQSPKMSAPSFGSSNSKSNPANSIESLGGNKYALPKNVVTENVDNMNVLQQALIVPNEDGGFLVKNVQQNGVFAKLGLRQGDVIKKVNDMPVNTMVDVMQLYRLTKDINKINNIRVELERGGTSQTLNYSLK